MVRLEPDRLANLRLLADHAVMSDTSTDPWTAPQPSSAVVIKRNPSLWHLQLAVGVFFLAATAFGVLAHHLHPRTEPWSRTLEPPALAICFLATATRTALAAGAITRNGWWLSRRTSTTLTVVAFVAALAVIVLGVAELTGDL
jgi:hypothetical protein